MGKSKKRHRFHKKHVELKPIESPDTPTKDWLTTLHKVSLLPDLKRINDRIDTRYQFVDEDDFFRMMKRHLEWIPTNTPEALKQLCWALCLLQTKSAVGYSDISTKKQNTFRIFLGAASQHHLTRALHQTDPTSYPIIALYLSKMTGVLSDQLDTQLRGAISTSIAARAALAYPAWKKAYLATIHEDMRLGVDLHVRVEGTGICLSIKSRRYTEPEHEQTLSIRQPEKDQSKRSIEMHRLVNAKNDIDQSWYCARITVGYTNETYFDGTISREREQAMKKLLESINDSFDKSCAARRQANQRKKKREALKLLRRY